MKDLNQISKAIHLMRKGATYAQAYRETGVSYKTIRRHMTLNDREGEEAHYRPGNRYYQTAEKVKAVLDVTDRGRSIQEVAAELGATDGSVRDWLAQYSTGGINALRDKRRGRKNAPKQ